MTGWISAPGEGTAGWYRLMAERELHGISPSYEAICVGVADDTEVPARLDTLPPSKRQPNLLLAAVRYLDGPVTSWPEFRAFLLDEWNAVAATMMQRRTQTNEPRRCATLLPALAALPQPLALLEVGASAGLCLFPDRWSYRYSGESGEHRLGAGPELSCAVTGPAPLPDAVPDVAWRAGLDLDPLYVTDEGDVRWLESLIWPEQGERFDTLRAAVAIARAEPPHLERGDLLTDLEAFAAQAPEAASLVVFHSAVLAYVAAHERAAFGAELARLRAGRTVIWLANEAPGVVAGTECLRDGASRFVLTRDGRPLARTGPHGHTLDWSA